MKVLMLGWEFPPFFAGGVGMVCAELTQALANFSDLSIEYVMAYGPDEDKKKGNLKVTSAHSKKYYDIVKNIDVTKIPTTIYAYDTCQSYINRNKEYIMSFESCTKRKNIKQLYGENLIQEVYLYAQRIAAIYKDRNDFDVIHAHDWTTIPAALLLKQLTGIPVVFHVHITELDKTGGMGGHEKVFEIEKLGFMGADILIAVSNFTKNRLINDYGVNPNKIRVVHNGGVSDLVKTLKYYKKEFFNNSKIILFAGRVTLQKGPEYFIRAARKVVDYEPDTKFIFAGGGDLLNDMIRMASDLGLEKNIFFNGGAYTRADADKYYAMADVFVMPSVSEPFGIVPFEAISKGTPTIISKQSGISEVLEHAFKVDFWDIDEMANKILALIKYDSLHQHMRQNGYNSIDNHTWEKPAQDIVRIYHEAANK